MDFLIPWKGTLSLLKLAGKQDVDKYAPKPAEPEYEFNFYSKQYKSQPVIMDNAATIEAYKKLLEDNQQISQTSWAGVSNTTVPFWANKKGKK